MHAWHNMNALRSSILALMSRLKCFTLSKIITHRSDARLPEMPGSLLLRIIFHGFLTNASSHDEVPIKRNSSRKACWIRRSILKKKSVL